MFPRPSTPPSFIHTTSTPLAACCKFKPFPNFQSFPYYFNYLGQTSCVVIADGSLLQGLSLALLTGCGYRVIMNTTKRRRRRRKCLHAFSLVPFLLFSPVCGDEDSARQDEGDISYGSSSSNSYNNSKEKKGYQNASPFCNQHFIEVNGVWITCDTPGAYYYGGSAYRNSEVCKTGDKAKLSFDCKLFPVTTGIFWTLHLTLSSSLQFMFPLILKIKPCH